MSAMLRLALAAALIAAPAALPAQRMSESYEFLKAVRDANGNKVNEILGKPGSSVINAKDTTNGESALHIVAKRSDVTYLRFLIGKGASLNQQDRAGNTPLLLATGERCFECVDELVKRRANLNLANNSGETPLIRAVQLRDVELARRLLTAGANPDQRDVIAGMSARDYATVDNRSPALAKLLTEAPKAGSRGVSGPVLR